MEYIDQDKGKAKKNGNVEDEEEDDEEENDEEEEDDDEEEEEEKKPKRSSNSKKAPPAKRAKAASSDDEEEGSEDVSVSFCCRLSMETSLKRHLFNVCVGGLCKLIIFCNLWILMTVLVLDWKIWNIVEMLTLILWS